MADQASGNDDEPVIVKKYANRRLYNTRSSSYITLDDLARMTREGIDFQVLDAKTGNDITHQILTQIIMEEECSGEQMLPDRLPAPADLDVRQFDAGDDAAVPRSLDGKLPRQPGEAAGRVEGEHGPASFRPPRRDQHGDVQGRGERLHAQGRKPAPKPAPKPADELDALREQMAAMQRKLDELGEVRLQDPPHFSAGQMGRGTAGRRLGGGGVNAR